MAALQKKGMNVTMEEANAYVQSKAEGSEQMLISPGALDMAGVIVTTRQEDFDKITEEKVASIIKEVGITVEEAEKIPGRYFDEKAKR